MKWMYDAVGEYCEYNGYTIVKQSHPFLLKYAIFKELADETLEFIEVFGTIKEVKNYLKEINKNGSKNLQRKRK